MTEIAFGQPLPNGLDYAVSFGIPTWNSAIGYAEHDPEVLEKMVTGYPRYFPQPPVQKLCNHFLKKFGRASEDCRPFPSLQLANECLAFVRSRFGSGSQAHLEVENIKFADKSELTVAAVLASNEEFGIVREYWKLRGEGVSSRQASFLTSLLEDRDSESNASQRADNSTFASAEKVGNAAKTIIRRRIIDNHYKPFGQESKDSGYEILNPETDVHLVSSGMSSIFKVRELLTFWENKRVSETGVTPCDTGAIFGFPFKDTQVIMKELGTSKFFGYGDSRDIEKLKEYLSSGKQRILAAFIETPSNPLLNMPDLKALRQLADKHGFVLVIDDTIGGLNVNIMPYADVVCTSLTKLFNGSSNAMGGSIIVNPKSVLYSTAREYFASDKFEDLLWNEDAVVLEQNSRDFEDRTLRCNENTELLVNKLLLPEVGKIFRKVYYPSVSSKETRANYDSVKSDRGGYGSMFSVALNSEKDAQTFYDSLKIFKGPSNGTNFTLACPYVHLAHHTELEDVSKYGADPNLVRVSVGLEDSAWLLDVFKTAIEDVKSRR